MVGDNPLNKEKWKLHGTHAEYWRSDNPFIVAWYRFGEDAYPIANTPEDRILTDSASRHHHLATNQASGSYIAEVSGIAPWSDQAIRFQGASWTDSSTNRALRVNSNYYRDRTDFSTLGTYGLGSAVASGITIMGWIQVPDTNTNRGTRKEIWGNIEGSVTAPGNGEWSVYLDYTQYAFGITYHSFGSRDPGGQDEIILLSTDNDDPNGVFPIDEPFFFAVQQNKGSPQSNVSISEGSGVFKLYIGTTVSGLRQVAEVGVEPRSNWWRGSETMKGNSDSPYTIGTDPTSARGNSSSSRNIPQNSIVDEFVIVNDGNMSLDRMQHYMNSGIIQDEQDPFGLVEPFVPELPGTDDLVAYWTFDEQGGANTSPNTPSYVSLDMVLNSVDFVPGVRGGSGIRPNRQFGNFNATNFGVNKTGLPHVIAGSGLNFLFPEKDQTWIGWVRSQGTGERGGCIGWFSDTNDRGIATYWGDYIFGIGSIREGSLDMGVTPSGAHGSVIPQRIACISAISNLFSPNAARSWEQGDWHLLAICFDITHGFIRVVRDAQDVYPCLMNGSFMVSGLTKEHLAGSDPDGAGWVLTNTNSSDRCSYDDWAVYDRILTLPEMSGYALSGIDITPVISPIDTSYRRTMGYWKLNEEETYDPENVSGVRYPDSSWYRHHLTNVSGSFEQGSFLNDNVALTTASVVTSGSIMAVGGVDSGPNLSMSTSGVWASSGFTAGCWMYLPSGDLGTEGNGSSGLFGDKMFMGVWNQALEDQSWMLGMRDNQFLAQVQMEGFGGIVTEVTSSSGVPFNTPFFVALKVVPSGGVTAVEVFISEDENDQSDLQLVAREAAAPGGPSLIAGGVSGFSLFGAPNQQFGFPSGTRMQMPFVYAGGLSEEDIARVKVAAINDNTLGSGAVSTSDPANISHWRFDERGAQVTDFGQAQNALFLANTDGNTIGIFEAVHTSGVVVRREEYLTTQTDSSTSGLDLGLDNKSWTFLTWIKPNTDVPQGESPFMGKGGPSSGIEVFMTESAYTPAARASGVTTQSFNGALAPGEWNHVAIVFDRDQDEFQTIVNGRYAGPYLNQLLPVPINNSGMAIGGRGDQENNALFGGPNFSGMMDDTMLFARAMTLPEISGLAANSYNYAQSSGTTEAGPIGGWIFGQAQNLISGLIASWIHGQGQDLELIAGYISGVSGCVDHIGGFIHGKAQVSGVFGGWLHGAGEVSGLFGHFIHGLDQISGLVGGYQFGACETSSEFDIVLNFRVVSFQDFDARLGVEKTQTYDFDARLGVIRITQPPDCSLEMPFLGTIVSGIPYDLTVQGSGIANDDKAVSKVRFTFADFKGAEEGTLVSGLANSGLYEATRQFDTPGWYTVKIEVLDSYGYRTSCCRPFLLLPSGSESGTYLSTLPGISITGTPSTGSAIHSVSLTHTLSGLATTSGVLEYTDFADQQESLVNSLEMPTGTQFIDLVRRHDYTMPGKYCPVWAVSGNFGIVSDTIAGGIDYLA